MDGTDFQDDETGSAATTDDDDDDDGDASFSSSSSSSSSSLSSSPIATATATATTLTPSATSVLSSSPSSLSSAQLHGLDRKLKMRSDKKDLISRNIMKSERVSPALLAAQSEVAKAKIESQLNRKLSNRPTKETLQSQNIMKVGDPKILQRQSALNRALIERTLEMRLAEKYGRRWASLNMREAEPLVQWNKTRTLSADDTRKSAPAAMISARRGTTDLTAQAASERLKKSLASPPLSPSALPPSKTSPHDRQPPSVYFRPRRGGLSSKASASTQLYSRIDRQLSLASITHKSEFITTIEQSGKFVCHNCCTEDGLGPELNSSRYTYQDFFNEKDWATVENLEPPIHNPEAKKQSLCNTCYGLCSCGRELKEGICSNCGSLAPITCDQIRAAPEFPRPVFKEDIITRKQQQLSKQHRIDRVEALARQSALHTSSGEDEPQAPSSGAEGDGSSSSAPNPDAERTVKRTKKRTKRPAHHRHTHHEHSEAESAAAPESHPPGKQTEGADKCGDETGGSGSSAHDDNESSETTDESDDSDSGHRKITIGGARVLGTYQRYRFLNVFVDECIFATVDESGHVSLVVEGTSPPVSLAVTESSEHFWFFHREEGGDLFAIARPLRCASVEESAGEGPGEGPGEGDAASAASATAAPKLAFPTNGPSNKSRVYLVDKANRSVYYFCDKKLGEYFAWKIETGDVVQVS